MIFAVFGSRSFISPLHIVINWKVFFTLIILITCFTAWWKEYNSLLQIYSATFVPNIITRKRSWRKGNHMTAVCVWRPLAKISTANQRYAISYWWLIVTVAALLTVWEIFSGVEAENRHFRPLYCYCSLLAEERPAISTQYMHRWKVHLVGYNSVADSTGLPSFV